MKRYFLLYVLFASALFYSCKNNATKDYSPSLTDSTSVSGLTGDSVKLIKTAAINFKVKNVEQSTRAVSELAAKYGGMIYEQNYQSPEDNRKELKVSDDSILVVSTATPQADVTVRVPSENLEAFLYDVSDIGYFTGSRHLKTDDESLQYLENGLRQKNRMENFPKQATIKPSTSSEKIQLKDEIIDQFIANKTIDAAANYSTVNLVLFQNALVRKEMIANYILEDYELPFNQRFKNALSKGWEFFLSILLAIVHLWVFLVVGIIAFALYKSYWLKRKLIN